MLGLLHNTYLYLLPKDLAYLCLCAISRGTHEFMTFSLGTCIRFYTLAVSVIGFMIKVNPIQFVLSPPGDAHLNVYSTYVICIKYLKINVLPFTSKEYNGKKNVTNV